MTNKGWRLAVALATASVVGAAGEETKVSPEEVLAGFEKRAEAMIRAKAGKPLQRAKKNPPLSPGRGEYVRGYSYSIVAFAAKCLYLNDGIARAE